jgi:hypothetical protein
MFVIETDYIRWKRVVYYDIKTMYSYKIPSKAIKNYLLEKWCEIWWIILQKQL